jgi:hypothetical protein
MIPRWTPSAERWSCPGSARSHSRVASRDLEVLAEQVPAKFHEPLLDLGGDLWGGIDRVLQVVLQVPAQPLQLRPV